MRRASCLFCTEEKKRFGHSGADIDAIAAVLQHGKTVLHGEYQGYTEIDIVQCQGCSSYWIFNYSYPDRPPFAVSAEKIEKETVELYLECTEGNMLQLLAGQAYLPPGGVMNWYLRTLATISNETAARLISNKNLPAAVRQAIKRKLEFYQLL